MAIFFIGLDENDMEAVDSLMVEMAIAEWVVSRHDEKPNSFQMKSLQNDLIVEDENEKTLSVNWDKAKFIIKYAYA